MKKSSSNKAVSVLLSVAMCPMLVPTAAFAAEEGAASDQAAVQAEAQTEDTTQAAAEGAIASTQAAEESAEVAVQADEATSSLVVVNGNTGYSTLEEAFAKAEPDNSGVITYTINGKADLTDTGWVQILKAGSTANRVEFVGNGSDAEICITGEAAILADQSNDVDVAFSGLKLTKLNPKILKDYGQCTNYFTTYLRNTNASENSVTYTNCEFPNGVCNNQYGKTVFNNCKFDNKAAGLYNLWVYGGDVTVSEGSFTGTRGVKVYTEGFPEVTPKTTISGTSFTGMSEKAAIVVSKPGSVVLDKVSASGCAKGLLEKKIDDISPSGSYVVTANDSNISGNFDITKSVTEDDAKAEFNITGGTFTSDSNVSADYLADGFELNQNADGTYGVQEKQAVAAKIGSKEYSSINDAASSAQSGDTIVLYADVDQPGRISLTNGVTVDLNGHNVSVSNAEAFIVEGWEESDQPAIVLNNSQETGGVVNGLSALKVDYSGNILAFQKSGNVTLESNQKGSPAVSLHSGAYLPLSDENVALAGSGWIASDADGAQYLYGADGDVFPYAGALDADHTLKLSGKYVGASSIYYKGTIGGETVPLVLDLDDFTYQSTDTTKNGVVTDAGSRASTKLTIQNGKLYSTTKNGVAVAVDGANLVLKDVAVDVAGANHAGVVTNGSLSNVNIAIEGGSVKSAKDAAVYFPSGGSLSVKDSSVTGSTTGVQVCAGSLSISGKTSITVNAGSANPALNSEGSIADGSPISLIQRTGYSSLKSAVIESTGTFKSSVKCPAVSAYSLNGTSKGVFDNADGIVSISAGTFYYGKPDSAFVKDGYGLSFYSNSSSYQVIDCSSAIATASYGDNGLYYYKAFNDAVKNAPEQGSVVTLLGDTDLGAVTAVAEQGITVDLNGHTVNGRAVNGILQVKGAGIQVLVKNGSLICSNEGESARAVYIYQTAGVSFDDVSVQCVGGYAVVVGESGTSRNGNVCLEVNGDHSSLKGGIAAIAALHKADGAGATKITINAGTVEGGNYAIAGSGNDGGTEIVVNGGLLKSTAPNGAGIYHPQKGTLTLNGGQIEGAVGVQICAGVLSVPDDSTVLVKATGSKNLDAAGSDGSIPDGSAISIVNRPGYKGIDSVNISSGKYETADQNATAVSAYMYDADNKTQTDFGNSEKIVSVSGGSFSSEVPSDLCAEGFAPAASTDAEGNTTYGVSDAVAIVDFMGGSLRMDYGDTYDKTCLRFGYHVGLPKGAILDSFGWNLMYGSIPNKVYEVVGTSTKLDADGSGFTANLVITGVKAKYYTEVDQTQMWVKYKTSDGKTVTCSDSEYKTRSVEFVANAISVSPSASEAEKSYAKGVLDAI